MTPGADYAALEDMVLALLDAKRLSESDVLKTVNTLGAQFFPDLSATQLQKVADGLLERLLIELELGTSVTGDDHVPWLEERKAQINWRRWGAYRKLLLKERRALKVLDKLSEATDEILDLAGDPAAPGAWQRRGLVIGEVQSGKTSTYIGLINKAADAGYRVFILIGGHTESLRRQTQARVDEGFVGRDSASLSKSLRHLVAEKRVGVGLVDPSIRAMGLTTVTSDYSSRTVQSFNFELSEDMQEPVVFVVKKNKKILENLHDWLVDQGPEGGSRIPLLLLDDEADYASINTRDEDDPTAINLAIRKLLAVSHRSSYVGFTATPFANVLIDADNSDDLFPQDFIYALESPSNYVGPEAVFHSTIESGIRELSDADACFPFAHKSSLVVDELPASLSSAICSFVIANAIRDLRGDQDEPRAMLVNVSRFNSVQQQVHELVEDELSSIRNAIEFDQASPLFDEVRASFESEYRETEFTWEEVRDALLAAVSPIRAVLVNSKTNSSESYSNLAIAGRTRIIATGGAVLSRGLTLNGLMISYFYQRSRAADTLMQMGRWFGYRDGYRDLCRVWIDPEVATWYEFVAEAILELRADLREMHNLGLTPRDFGLKVRKHPESLLVTAANKSRFAQEVEQTISVRDKTLESTKLEIGLDSRESNLAAVHWLLDQATDAEASSNRLIFRGVGRTAVAEFLARFEASPSEVYFSKASLLGRSPLAEYVRTAADPDLRSWDLLVVGGSSERREMIGGDSIRWAERNLEARGSAVLVSGARRRVAGSSDLAALVSPEDLSDLRASDRGATEKALRSRLKRPALLVYFLTGRDVLFDPPFVGVKIAYPADPRGLQHDARTDAGPRYLINSVLQRDWLPELSLDFDDEDLDV